MDMADLERSDNSLKRIYFFINWARYARTFSFFFLFTRQWIRLKFLPVSVS